MEENHSTQINKEICQFLNQLTPGYSYQPEDDEIVKEVLYKKAIGVETRTAPIFLLASMDDPPETLIAPFPHLKQSDNYHFLFKGEPPKLIGHNLMWKHSRTQKLTPILHGINAIGYKDKYYLRDNTKKSMGWLMTVYKLEPRFFNLPCETEWRFIKLEPPRLWRKNPAPTLEDSTHNEEVVLTQNEGMAQLNDGEAQYADANLAHMQTQSPDVAHQVQFADTNLTQWNTQLPEVTDLAQYAGANLAQSNTQLPVVAQNDVQFWQQLRDFDSLF